MPDVAYERAVELATEYQRKILPFTRRLTMPEVSNYWQWGVTGKEGSDKGVTLGNASDAMPLANFISWLDIFLTGPVNGLEDSRQPLPIPSIRALSQLVRYCSDFIQELPEAIRTAKSELEVRRIWQMPTTPLADIATFHHKHQELGKKDNPDYAEAYKEFSDKIKIPPAVNYSYGNPRQGDSSKKRVERNDLAQKLADYFCFEPNAGAAYLTLLAKLYWKSWSDAHSLMQRNSIFDTPLFQPLIHTAANLELFDKSEDLSSWSILLDKRLPEEWLAGIKPKKTILPYPVAEVGVNSSKSWAYPKEIQEYTAEGLDDGKKEKAAFLITLLAQRNFYTNAKQTMLLNIGRVFELIIASIAGPLLIEDIHAILSRAPFYSTGALAPTKTILFEENIGRPPSPLGEFSTKEHIRHIESIELITKLHDEISEWRKTYHVDQIELSPWLVYKVFNKVYSQVSSNEKHPYGIQHIGTALNMVAHTFYATWFAFGSFEKGELFGLPNLVATTNINPENLKNYENNDQFNLNILPFSPTLKQVSNKDDGYEIKCGFGKQARVVSYVLAGHPLKMWIDEIISLDWSKSARSAKKMATPKETEPKVVKTSLPKAWLCEKLNLNVENRLTEASISKAIGNWTEDQCNSLAKEMETEFPKAAERMVLQKAIDKKFPKES